MLACLARGSAHVHDVQMGRVRAKICGIGTAADLEAAVEAGADAVGLICGTTHFSEDVLTVSAARDLAVAVPAFVSTVLVTHLLMADDILSLADAVGVDTVQVHGEVSIETVREVFTRRRRSLRVVAAVHVTGGDAVDRALEMAGVSDAVLLDSRTDSRLGGTGQTHDWDVSRSIVEALAEVGRPVILAGGLDGSNVLSAVRMVGPYGVDANSRLKGPDGRKDPVACAAFIRAALLADSSLNGLGGRADATIRAY